MTRDITAYNQEYDISYQLGAYYDMRYRQYITRHRFILGLSKYNEDDTVYEREETLEIHPEYSRGRDLLEELKIKYEHEKNKMNDSTADCPTIQEPNQMSKCFQKENQYDEFDEIENKCLLNKYPDIDEQELEVCRTMMGAMWDLHSGFNMASYHIVVGQLLMHPQHHRRDLFPTIKNIEDTIKRLINKGIVSQDIESNGDLINGIIRWRYDEPYIILFFNEGQEDLMMAIDESFALSFRRHEDLNRNIMKHRSVLIIALFMSVILSK